MRKKVARRREMSKLLRRLCMELRSCSNTGGFQLLGRRAADAIEALFDDNVAMMHVLLELEISIEKIDSSSRLAKWQGLS